uniref:Secreted peptide n=1 Tax=Leersia perrieri TaxID=77586 RepID=A0A0D9XUE1_9ORYZ
MLLLLQCVASCDAQFVMLLLLVMLLLQCVASCVAQSVYICCCHAQFVYICCCHAHFVQRNAKYCHVITTMLYLMLLPCSICCYSHILLPCCEFII